MTNRQVFELRTGLEQNIQGLRALRGMKFAYALGKNLKTLASEIETFSSLITPSEEFKAFEEARKNQCETFCEKDENGEMVLIENNTQYKIDVTSEEWIAAYKELEAEYKDAIDARNKQIEDYNTFLTSESDIELHMISIDDVPENISVEEFELIEAFIK